MKIKVLSPQFSICKVKDFSQVNWEDEYCFIGKTDEENSLVCSTGNIPVNCITREDGWRAFRIEGELDFSLVGILSKISTILANHQIGIFVISTFNTDYILTKQENFEKALQVLKEEGIG